jgi:predicted solute-binding protein
MRRHAQEQSDDVLWAHVELYVTEETRSLSPAGRAALGVLERRAAERGLAPPGEALAVIG